MSPPPTGTIRTRGTGGNMDEPRETRCTHSIAIRKQTTASPEKIPIRTARNINNWSSRSERMRLLQDLQVAHRFRMDGRELWEIGSGWVSGGSGGRLVKLISSHQPGYARSATERSQRLAALRTDLCPRPLSQRPKTWRARCVQDICEDCVQSNRLRFGCFLPLRRRGPMSKRLATMHRRF